MSSRFRECEYFAIINKTVTLHETHIKASRKRQTQHTLPITGLNTATSSAAPYAPSVSAGLYDRHWVRCTQVCGSPQGSPPQGGSSGGSSVKPSHGTGQTHGSRFWLVPLTYHLACWQREQGHCAVHVCREEVPASKAQRAQRVQRLCGWMEM